MTAMMIVLSCNLRSSVFLKNNSSNTVIIERLKYYLINIHKELNKVPITILLKINQVGITISHIFFFFISFV